MCKVVLARMSNRTSSNINTNPSTTEIETYLLCDAYGLADQSALLDERYRVVSAGVTGLQLDRVLLPWKAMRKLYRCNE